MRPATRRNLTYTLPATFSSHRKTASVQPGETDVDPFACPPGNQLLALLPPGESERILNDATLVDLTFGSILWEKGDRIRDVHFPATSFILRLTTVDDRTLEVGMIGDEGMCGHSLALGVDSAPLRALVQGSGKSLQLKSFNLPAASGA